MGKKLLKVLGIVLLVIVVAAGGFVVFLTAALPLDGSEHRRVAALKRVVSVKHGSPPFEKARFPSPSESGPTGLCLSSRARD